MPLTRTRWSAPTGNSTRVSAIGLQATTTSPFPSATGLNRNANTPSGAGTDPSGAGKVMWARVKGQTENALLALPFRSAHMLRPGFIQPLHGIRSKTPAYRIIYALMAPLTPLLKRLAPGFVLTTESLGRAMLRIAREGHPKPRLEVADLQRLVP